MRRSAVARVASGIARSNSGSVAVPGALVLAMMLLCAGMAVDYARAFADRTRMQAAMDAAVIAAAKDLNGDVSKLLMQVFEQNFPGTAVAITGNRLGVDSVEGLATASVPTTLLQLIGLSSLPVSVRSVATVKTVGSGCIHVLDPSASQAFLVNSGADVQAPDCEIHVHSTASPAAIFNAGTSINALRICIAGNNIIDNGGSHDNLELGCTPAPDPFAGKLPVPSSSGCKFPAANYNGGAVNLTPGIYCGWHNFNAGTTVNFAPGVYVIKSGGWNVDGGTWRGNGVTFYFADTSKIQFNSAVDAVLTAPTSGPYAGIIIYEAAGLPKSQFVLDDSRGFDIQDLVYLPSRDTTFNSGSQIRSKRFTLFVNTLILDQTRWQLQPGAMAGSGTTAAPRLTN